MKYCSFCKSSKEEVKTLIEGEDGVCICDACALGCVELSNKKDVDGDVVSSVTTEIGKDLTPKKIFEFLNEYLIGQEGVKKAMSVAVYNHYKRLESKSTEVDIAKSNVLLIGPTGSGKTLLGQTIAKLLDVPFVIADATSLTEAGYVGDDVETILQRLINAADGDVERAQRGIVFVDEIDKLAKREAGSSVTRDVSGEGVQQALLKIIEGSLARIPQQGTRKHPNSQVEYIDTKNILFICGGAFVGLEQILEKKSKNGLGFISEKKEQTKEDSFLEKFNKKIKPEDLVHFGLIPEFIGRLPVICILEELNRDELKQVMVEPKNSIYKQFQELLKIDDVELVIEDKAIGQVVDLAVKYKTGARSLRGIVEEVLNPTMFVLPDRKDVVKVVVKDIYEDPEFVLKE